MSPFSFETSGQANVRLDLPDRVASLRVRVDGHADGGRIGSGSQEIRSQLPLWLDAMLPPEAASGDRIDLCVAAVNETNQKLMVDLALEHGPLVQVEAQPRREFPVQPHQRARQFLSLHVLGPSGDCRLRFRGSAGQFSHEVTRSLKIVPAEDRRAAADTRRTDGDPCPVQLSTRLAQDKVRWGQTVALSAEVMNATDRGQPGVVAVLGLPAGLEAPLGHLDALQKAGKFDYYQTRARQVICHWRTLAPKSNVEFQLQLIAAIPGKYAGPASRAYASDAPERAHWNDPLAVEITPE